MITNDSKFLTYNPRDVFEKLCSSHFYSLTFMDTMFTYLQSCKIIGTYF